MMVYDIFGHLSIILKEATNFDLRVNLLSLLNKPKLFDSLEKMLRINDGYRSAQKDNYLADLCFLFLLSTYKWYFVTKIVLTYCEKKLF